MKWVGGGRNKIELLTILAGLFVLGVDGKSANPGNIGCLHCAQNSVTEECPPDIHFLPVSIYGKASKKHHRHWMASEPLLQSLGCIAVLNLCDGQTVKTNHRVAHHANVGLSSAGPLILQRMLAKPDV